MQQRRFRVLLLTSCLVFLLLLLSAFVTPPGVAIANGDPDEIVEKGPEAGDPGFPDPPPPPDPGGDDLGDPDEIIEGGQDPFAPPGGGSMGMRVVGEGSTSTLWLILETLGGTFFFVF